MLMAYSVAHELLVMAVSSSFVKGSVTMFNHKVSWLALALVAGMVGGIVSSRVLRTSAKEVSVSDDSEIIVPPQGLTFKTKDGKPVAKLISLKDDRGGRNTLFIFNETGSRAVELNAFSSGGDVSVYDNRDRGAALSIFATANGGQLTLMGDLKAGIQLSAGKEGGLMTVNEGDGLPAVTVSAKAHRGNIQVTKNTGSEVRPLWNAP
jgi:hypothetical protein